MSFRILVWLCAFVLSFGATQAHAAASAWDGIDKTQVRLISAQTALGDQRQALLGLHFKMQPGWKVYWRSPGDAGFPPEIDWSGSENLQDAAMRWPKPERFEVLGLETLGYKDEVVYPLLIDVQDPSKPLDISAHVRFLTCDDVCIPVDKTLTLQLDSAPAEVSDEAHLINQFNSLVPLDGSTYGISVKKAELFGAEDGKNGTLRFHLEAERPFVSPDAIGEGPVELVFFRPRFATNAAADEWVVDVPFDGLQFMETAPEGFDYTLTVMDGERAVELTSSVTLMSAAFSLPEGFQVFGSPTTDAFSAMSLGLILGFALLGGLILNLMPCVLPVLSIKVLGVISHGGADPKQVRLSFLASAAGILCSFWVLAGGLMALKVAGASIGWGIQFQQPLFLIALSLIVVLFACNMWGLFEINLPQSLSAKMGAKGQGGKLGGHFMTGAFATLLATPCSAPFLGTAVGFALSRGPFEILSVFTALGIGLALPYLLIAAVPTLATRLPKPGPWMITLRKILALALLGTALWLVTVLMAQIGMDAALVFAGLLAALILVFALKSRMQTLALPLVVVVAAASFVIPSFAERSEIDVVAAEQLWRPFDQSQIRHLVSEGHVVFVDVTAEWCITCQVNKNLVLYQGETFDYLSDPAITAMKADWTNPDPVIADYLASFQKYAIPFNAVYGPGAPDGIVLPELLSQDSVLQALEKAKG